MGELLTESLYHFTLFISLTNSSLCSTPLKFFITSILLSKSIKSIIAVSAIVVVLVVFSYLHKRHVEYKMVDIENAVRSAYSEGVTSVEKEALVKAVKKYFHCSSKEAHYIIGVARRKKIIDIAVGKVSLHQDS